MNLLNKLTIKNLKLNQKRTIVTVIGIILSVALLTAVASMFFSARASLIDYQKEQSGNYHYKFMDVSPEDISMFQLNRKVEKTLLTENLGYASLEGIENEYKPYVYVKAFTEDAFADLNVELLEGRFPENDKEIVISEHLISNGGVALKVGDKLTLDIGSRMCDGYEQTQENPFDPSLPEEIVNTITHEYEIVGIINRLSYHAEGYSAPGYTLITYLDEENITHPLDVYVRYTKADLKDHLEITANILQADEDAFVTYHGSDEIYSMTEEDFAALEEKAMDVKYQFDTNGNLIMLETGILTDSTLLMLAVAGGIVVLIIIFTSVYCIKNSFDISITEKIRQYGMLSSIGATRKQIKRNVYYEASLLGLMGIPVGILSGIFASFVLVKITDYLLGEALTFEMKFAFSWLTIVISVLLGLLTIYLSAQKSANRASKIAPIRAIRNNDDIKISAQNVKTPKWVGRFFGIGGEISYKNLQRSKKKYRTTVISIVVCVIVFITVSSFVDFAFHTVKAQYQDWNYNIVVGYESGTSVEEKFEEIRNLDHLEDISKQIAVSFVFDTDKYTDEYFEFCEETGMLEDENAQKGDVIQENLIVHVLDNYSYKKYVKELGLDFEKVRDKGILLNHIFAQNYDVETNQLRKTEMDQFTFKAGDVITGTIASSGEEEVESKQVSIEIAAVAKDKIPFGFDEYRDWAVMVVGEDCKDMLLDNYYYGYIYINSNDAGATEKELETILGEDYGSISNFDEWMQSEKSLFTLIAIFLYGFITVIALIGVTNIFNTITTNMNLRRREFAMLKSVGMTKKEFNRMIQLESFFYGMKSLVIGIPVGCLISFGVYYVMTEGMIILAYKLPWRAIIISIAAVFLLITVIMKYSISKIDKQNVIETIRNENI